VNKRIGLARTSAALTLGAALALAGSVALAQGQPQPQPQPGGPGRIFPGQPQPQPGGPGRPPVILGPDGRPQGLPPGSRRPTPPPGMGRPGGFPGGPGMGRPGGPPGTGRPQRPGSGAPHPRPHAAEHEEEHEGGEHECPGHRPDDIPPDVNFWHGMLMVDNDRALQPSFLNRLLFRYYDPHNPCDQRNEPPPYLASLLNFAVLALVLYRFARKPIAEALLQRRKAIMGEIDDATHLKEDAEQRLQKYEDWMDNIQDKLTEVRAEFAAQAEAEKKHILAEVEERRLRLRRDADFRIEQERKAMREELLHEAVVAATAAAEALILQQLTSADQDRMAKDFLGSVGTALQPGAQS
jgi:F-type H+-transporting ATPase subunit b